MTVPLRVNTADPTYTTGFHDEPNLTTTGRVRVDLPTGAGATQVQGTAADGAAAVGNPVQVGGVDGGGLAQALSVDTAGRVDVNPVSGQTGVAAGAGVVGVTVQRTTLASDDPAVTALQVMDDWDEADRAKVNPVVGQAGLAAGTGIDAVNALRVSLATNVALPTGSNIVGRVGVDQTTPGTTDSVTVATGQGAGATIGTTADAAVDTNAVGTLSAKLRGAVSRLVELLARLPAALGGGAEAGALLVTVATDSTGVLSVDDNGSTLTVDAPAGTPVAVQISDGAALQTAAALDLDTGVGTVTRVAMGIAAAASGGPVAVQGGGGTEAAALRVTMATDSTGVLSVDDNGSALTVDSAQLPASLGATTAAGSLSVAPATDSVGSQGGSGTATATTMRVTQATDVRVGVDAISGQTGLAGGTGVDGANVPRVSLATNVALPAGNNNIGDVDVASVPAPLSTTGGGTEATALRVTVASDSTGTLTVDDGGASLTVDSPQFPEALDSARFATRNQFPQSDTTGTEVRASAALTAGFVATTGSDCRDFAYVDWFVHLTAAGDGPITRLDYQIECSEDNVAWALLKTESVDTGVATLSTYEPRDSSITARSYVVSAPVTGRYMRLYVKAGAGTVTNSACSVDAYRRSSNA